MDPEGWHDRDSSPSQEKSTLRDSWELRECKEFETMASLGNSRGARETLGYHRSLWMLHVARFTPDAQRWQIDSTKPYPTQRNLQKV